MLVIDCCLRGEDSATRRYYQAYLEAATPERVEMVELARLGLRPLDWETLAIHREFSGGRETLALRDRLSAEGRFDHVLFHLARQFRDAEEILIAAPFWDLSFPSLLKVYLERVSVAGLTFGYTQEGQCVGHCRARRLLYFSTCGGYVGEEHLGFAYVKALGAMLGIPECVPYILEGLDIDPARREAVLAEGIGRLKAAQDIKKG